MALKAAMWIPGNAALVEYPERLTERPSLPQPKGFPRLPPTRKGNIVGATVSFSQIFRGEGIDFNWFHFPIATPVILDDVRPQLLKVFVFYATQLSRVSAVHIWDGPRTVSELNNLLLEGDHSVGIDGSNEFVMNPPITIFFGLNISVRVDFVPEEASQPQIRSIIFFSSAGADFITP